MNDDDIVNNLKLLPKDIIINKIIPYLQLLNLEEIRKLKNEISLLTYYRDDMFSNGLYSYCHGSQFKHLQSDNIKLNELYNDIKDIAKYHIEIVMTNDCHGYHTSGYRCDSCKLLFCQYHMLYYEEGISLTCIGCTLKDEQICSMKYCNKPLYERDGNTLIEKRQKCFVCNKWFCLEHDLCDTCKN